MLTRKTAKLSVNRLEDRWNPAVLDLTAAGAFGQVGDAVFAQFSGTSNVPTDTFLSIDGMYRAMGEPGRDPANPKFADHCFTGAYPTHLTDQSEVEPQPRQLSLLAEAS